ncbi:hypothetical protein HDU91_002284 [Kappamyces sp. JEL0680]|nr:hypothetical protein HDU91_002284 [Kappamyces sp. JEL0680]
MDLSTTVALSAAAVSTLVLFYRKNAIGSYPRYGDEVQAVPCSVPILGGLPWYALLGNVHRMDEYIVKDNAMNATNRPLFASVPFNANVVIISDPESLKHVLSTNFDNYQKGIVFKPYLTDAFGHGIFNSDGAASLDVG